MYNLHLKHVFKLSYSRGQKKKKKFNLLIIFLKYKKISSSCFYIIEDKYFLIYDMF